MERHIEPAVALTYLLQHTAAMMGRQTDQMLQERLGIGVSQLRILMMLQREPNMQQRKLADVLGQTEASVSRQIKLLEQKGLLTVRVNPKSRREHQMIPEPKGIKVTEAALEVVNQYATPIAELLTDKQREQLNEMIGLIHGHVCAPGKLYACNHAFDES